MNPLMGKDLRKLGFVEFAKKENVVAVRGEANRRREEKTEVRMCIMNHLQNQASHSEVNVQSDVEYSPSWQGHVRSRLNNLGLTL